MVKLTRVTMRQLVSLPSGVLPAGSEVVVFDDALASTLIAMGAAVLISPSTGEAGTSP